VAIPGSLTNSKAGPELTFLSEKFLKNLHPRGLKNACEFKYFPILADIHKKNIGVGDDFQVWKEKTFSAVCRFFSFFRHWVRSGFCPVNRIDICVSPVSIRENFRHYWISIKKIEDHQ